MSERSGGSIGRRILRTLALPIAAVVVLLAVITVAQVGNLRSAAATSRAVTLALAVQHLVQELQTERGVTTGLLGGNAGFRAELTPIRRQVDAQRAAVARLVDDPNRTALRGLDALAGVRAGADAGTAARAPTFTFYTARIRALIDVDFGLNRSSDATLRRTVEALDALGELKESTAQARAFLNGVFSAGGFRGGEFLQFVTIRSTADAAATAFVRRADARARSGLAYLFDTGAAREAVYFQKLALAAGDGRYLQVNPQSWWSALTTVLDDMQQLQQHVGSVIQARADTLRRAATTRLGALLGVVLLALIGSVYTAMRASRSIARPLAALAAEANRLAVTRLPDAVHRATSGRSDAEPAAVPVPPSATDEIRLVADALTRVQATAYALATEQARLRRSTAESLANLGRRNQNLLRRQLGFITELEREEADPTGLANLFELDHLATRMRRNAESLLVLVGAASPRQWSEPLPVTDVIRGAVSEVEEYRRVVLRRVDPVLVSGAVVSGVAHMLAELIENGLSFSPPDVEVEVHGRRLPEGYLIAVFDQGVGLSAAELERANQRLRGEGDFITAPARFLGHYVVGRLAVDMGIEVQLAASPVTGVTARVLLPPALLTDAPALLSPRRPALPVATPAEAIRPGEASAASAPTPTASSAAAPAPTASAAAPAAVAGPAAAWPSSLAAEPVAAVRFAPAWPAAAPGAEGAEGTEGAGGAPRLGRAASRAERLARGATVESIVLARSRGRTDAGARPVSSLGPYADPSPGTSAIPAGGAVPGQRDAADDHAERTRNGLRKRTPRARKPVPVAAPTGERPALLEESPDALRARLSAFRDGVHRGTSDRDGAHHRANHSGAGDHGASDHDGVHRRANHSGASDRGANHRGANHRGANHRGTSHPGTGSDSEH